MPDRTPILASTILCPYCGHRATETMPTDACQFFYDCRACGALLKPKPGDCCVFCSYGTMPCPPVQAGNSAPGCCVGDGAALATGRGDPLGGRRWSSPARGCACEHGRTNDSGVVCRAGFSHSR